MISARSNLELTSLNVTTGTTSQSKRISSLKKKPPSGTRRKTEDELKNCECVSSAGMLVIMCVCVCVWCVRGVCMCVYGACVVCACV